MNSALLLALLAAAPAFARGPEPSATARAEYLKGTLLERRGAFAEALAAYERALALDPDSAFLAGEASELAVELQDWDRAERWARRRLELAPKDAKSQTTLARALWARGETVKAEKAYEEALKLDPASTDSVFALQELIAPREPARARVLLEKFLKENPENAAVTLRELGRLDAQEGRYPEAAKRLKRSIELDDAESGPARLLLAQVYEVTRDTLAAVAEYRRLVADDPEELELAIRLGELEGIAGDLVAARATFARLLERRPGEPAASSWLAADAEKSGDFTRAAALLRASSALQNDPTLNLRLGYYELQAGGTKAAMKTLSAARKRWPKDERIAYYLALGHDDLGEHGQAVALLREVVAGKPGDREARWQLATILEKLDRVDEAEPEFARLIAEKPDDATALNYLGYALADRGLKLTEAEAYIRRARALEPANAAYRDSLGWVLFKQGRADEALVELAAAARSLPDDETIWNHLGHAYKAQDRAATAWRAFRLSESLGGEASEREAERLEKGLSAEERGELWRAHLELVHGGLRRMTGVCELKGKVAGRAIERGALLSFRAPRSLSFELLGPMFSTAWRARVDGTLFAMDPLPLEGVDSEKVEEAARGAFSAMAGALSAAPFEAGPARAARSWGRARLERPDWTVELERGLARGVAPSDGSRGATLSDFVRFGVRRLPRTLEVKGRFWEFAIVCPEPKAEFAPASLPLEAE